MSESQSPYPTDEIIAFYTRGLKHFGTLPSAQGYNSRHSQWQRFAALGEVGDLQDCSVLDVGCGLADFYAYLIQQGVEVDYTGLDFTPQMIVQARERHPNLRLELCDVMTEEPEPAWEADYVVASGLFSHVDEVRLQQTLPKMFAWCRKACAFNVLNAHASVAEPSRFYADPMVTLQFCLSITPWAVLRLDYLPNDFTVYLYREPKQG